MELRAENLLNVMGAFFFSSLYVSINIHTSHSSDLVYNISKIKLQASSSFIIQIQFVLTNNFTC